MLRPHRARALAERTLLIASVLAALAVALAWRGSPPRPPGVAVAVQDDRLAVVPLREIPRRLDLLARTGATLTRVDLLWSQVAPRRPRNPVLAADPAYRWGRYDRIMLGLARRGIAPILTIFSSPRWAARGPEAADRRPVNPNAPDPAAFGAFVAAVARRYDGRHAARGLGRLPEVRRLELWNEPNLGFFLRPQVDAGGRPVAAGRYAAMVRAGYRGAKSGNARAIVIAGAAAARGSSGRSGVGALPWLRALGAARVPFDAYSQHLYPAAAPGVPTPAVPSWHTLPRLLGELARIRPGTPLYVTEAGYTTAPTPHHRSTVTPAQQAANLRQIFALPQVRPPRVTAVVWFNLQDNAAWPSGLLGLDGRPKPSLQAFREAAAGNPRGRGGPGANAVLEALAWAALGAVVLAWLGSSRRPRAS